jgi:hypothetical protein
VPVTKEYRPRAEETVVVKRLRDGHAEAFGGVMDRWGRKREKVVHVDDVGPKGFDLLVNGVIGSLIPGGKEAHF